MTDEVEQDDGELSPAELRNVAKLSSASLAAIDDVLHRQASTEWRKVARIIGTAMLSMADRPKGVPDIFFAKRVEQLVLSGALESQGNLRRMRFSEVRLPSIGLGSN